MYLSLDGGAIVGNIGVSGSITGTFEGTYGSDVPVSVITGLATVATSGSYVDFLYKPVLGGAASLNVGTVAGSVAAGNDSRIVGALQPSAIPAASGQLMGGSGTVGIASSITIGTGLELASGTLNVTVSTDFIGLTGTATYAQLPIEVQSFPLSFTIPGLPLASQVYNSVIAFPITVPANLAGTVVYSSTIATADATWILNQISGGVTTAVASITITPISTTSATLSTQAAISFVAGDVLQLVAPSIPDATLAGVGITILASKA